MKMLCCWIEKSQLLFKLAFLYLSGRIYIKINKYVAYKLESMNLSLFIFYNVTYSCHANVIIYKKLLFRGEVWKLIPMLCKVPFSILILRQASYNTFRNIDECDRGTSKLSHLRADT